MAGYPMGGDSLSITKGIVSRVVMTRYAHASNKLLGIQIDAAINPGNSGGPAFLDLQQVAPFVPEVLLIGLRGVDLKYLQDARAVGLEQHRCWVESTCRTCPQGLEVLTMPEGQVVQLSMSLTACLKIRAGAPGY